MLLISTILLAVGQVSEPMLGGFLPSKTADDTLTGDYCIDGRYYKGATYRFGRYAAWLSDEAKEGIKEAYLFEDPFVRVLAVEATLRPNLFEQLMAQDVPCPQTQPLQMRSDFVSDEGGFNNTQQRLAQTQYIWIEKVISTDVLNHIPTRTIRGAAPVDSPINITNPFSTPIEITVVYHYEGGTKKPSPKLVKHQIKLGPGQNKILTERNQLAKPSGKDKRAYKLSEIYVIGKHPKALGSPFYAYEN